MEEEEYIVSKILQIRENKYGETEYYLVWEGYEDEGACWENESDLVDLGAENLEVALKEFKDKKSSQRTAKKASNSFNNKEEVSEISTTTTPTTTLKSTSKQQQAINSNNNNNNNNNNNDTSEIGDSLSISIKLFDTSNAIAPSLLRPWTINNLKSLQKIPKTYVLRLIYMCSRKFLQSHSLTRPKRLDVPTFMNIYKQWCNLLTSKPQTELVQSQYFYPADISPPIINQPHDTLFNTFMYLDDLRDIMACAGTCQKWNKIANGKFWKPVYLSCCGPPTTQQLAYYQGDYRELFFLLLERWGRPSQSRGQANSLCLLCKEFCSLRRTDSTTVKLVKLLEKGYDPNFGGKRFFPMQIALQHEDIELIQLLMSYGGDPSKFMTQNTKFSPEIESLIAAFMNRDTSAEGGGNESKRYLRRRGWKNRFNCNENWLRNLNFRELI